MAVFSKFASFVVALNVGVAAYDAAMEPKQKPRRERGHHGAQGVAASEPDEEPDCRICYQDETVVELSKFEHNGGCQYRMCFNCAEKEKRRNEDRCLNRCKLSQEEQEEYWKPLSFRDLKKERAELGKKWQVSRCGPLAWIGKTKESVKFEKKLQENWGKLLACGGNFEGELGDKIANYMEQEEKTEIPGRRETQRYLNKSEKKDLLRLVCNSKSLWIRGGDLPGVSQQNWVHNGRVLRFEINSEGTLRQLQRSEEIDKKVNDLDKKESLEFLEACIKTLNDRNNVAPGQVFIIHSDLIIETVQNGAAYFKYKLHEGNIIKIDKIDYETCEIELTVLSYGHPQYTKYGKKSYFSKERTLEVKSKDVLKENQENLVSDVKTLGPKAQGKLNARMPMDNMIKLLCCTRAKAADAQKFYLGSELGVTQESGQKKEANKNERSRTVGYNSYVGGDVLDALNLFL